MDENDAFARTVEIDDDLDENDAFAKTVYIDDEFRCLMRMMLLQKLLKLMMILE